jgi:hypothetical protein
MSALSTSPRLIKGAIVGIDPLNPLASVIIFQYNPVQISRQLEARSGGGEGRSSEQTRLSGAPKETITLNEVIMDATDQLADRDQVAGTMGIYPQLSALEMLLYPKSALVITNTVLLAAGTIELVPQDAPLTLFIWGAKRVVPVKITSFSITEERYDPNLNPIAAKVNLGMQVLSYNDLSVMHPGYHMFLAHQVVKETMAVVGSVGNLSAVGGGRVKLF